MLKMPAPSHVPAFELVRDPAAPIVGATFHQPAPRRALRPRRIGAARFVALAAVISAAVILTACGGGADAEPCPAGAAIVAGQCQAAPDVSIPPAPDRPRSI